VTILVRRRLAYLGRYARWPLRIVLGILVLTAGMSMWNYARNPALPPRVDLVVNDITGLNPIPVAAIITPTRVDEIAQAVRTHAGPISIGGGRFSQGGQTAEPGALQIDMREFKRILAIDTAAKTIIVQAGARWRDLQEALDPHNLSVKIMQTYANFTVGGSVSVNVHGRYVGQGPLVRSIRSLHVILADGSIIEASRTRNPDVFAGVVGGYGGLGVITDVTLDLADNLVVERRNEVMPIGAYAPYFMAHIRNAPGAVVHNADIYPDDYTTINATTFWTTRSAPTITDRLISPNRSYRLNRVVYWIISEAPGGKWIRQHVIDPIVFRGHPVVWRNHEASYDVAELEPWSRTAATYVLQEYFVPVERFDAFVPAMRAVFQRHRVNVINVSIRHALPDSVSLLNWARKEVFAFVVYYKQGTDQAARDSVRVWTRELLDSALAVGGTYYLPYQPQATRAQFARAYPRAATFFALKRRLDPTNKFRNMLWDTYDPGVKDVPLDSSAVGSTHRLARLPGYRRPDSDTFLQHPEWYIVYSSEEYGRHLAGRRPSTFPYGVSIGQYWRTYQQASTEASAYPMNWGYHVMLWVIGISYAAELSLKALYEDTIGSTFEWTAGGQRTPEEDLAAEVAQDYARFIHDRPWYEYRFVPRLWQVWGDLPLWSDHPLRSWERKGFLTLEYGVKSAYAGIITLATHAAYDRQPERTSLLVTGWRDSLSRALPGVTVEQTLDHGYTVLTAGRFDPTRDLLLRLAQTGPADVQVHAIAGRDVTVFTGTAPMDWVPPGGLGRVLYTLPVPTRPIRRRFLFEARTDDLLRWLRQLERDPALVIDHVYD
jgi:FAD/FMN-containing dehydrogenase